MAKNGKDRKRTSRVLSEIDTVVRGNPQGVLAVRTQRKKGKRTAETQRVALLLSEDPPGPDNRVIEAQDGEIVLDPKDLTLADVARLERKYADRGGLRSRIVGDTSAHLNPETGRQGFFEGLGSAPGDPSGPSGQGTGASSDEGLGGGGREVSRSPGPGRRRSGIDRAREMMSRMTHTKEDVPTREQFRRTGIGQALEMGKRSSVGNVNEPTISNTMQSRAKISRAFSRGQLGDLGDVVGGAPATQGGSGDAGSVDITQDVSSFDALVGQLGLLPDDVRQVLGIPTDEFARFINSGGSILNGIPAVPQRGPGNRGRILNRIPPEPLFDRGPGNR